ncbi:IS1182 family transposase [Companilactobacillus mishanensis]|uniref:IS1182 family transposase n=1 Tax=Companilactobacillus mishanensis TaxID=2486008 RepID=A0A5P0ZKP2_9LACO|nr:IS1182 family transposase [Companilactobacillus mishanensis]MQS53644.1 IS1182 family transposase [Companilactobacillus mishanensis]
MLKQQEALKLSPYSDLYDILIPKDNELRQLNELVDFSFVYDELADKYCKDDGRNAIDPIQMFKYLYLKVYYDLSDRDLIERTKTDMAMKFFLGLNPEDEVIHPSLLTKFRRQRLKDTDLLNLLISKTIKIAMENEIIKGNRVIVDSTHTAASFKQKSPVETLRHKSKLLRKELYKVNEEIKSDLPEKNTLNGLEKEKTYTDKLIKKVNEHPELLVNDKIRKSLHVLEELQDDIKEHQEYSKDNDAKIGHKSRNSSFFGYKTHIAMTDERIITAAIVSSGEKGDGRFLQDLLDQTRLRKVQIKEVIGDRAYSGKENIEASINDHYALISRLLPTISNGVRKQEDLWDFNKDAGMFVCPAGHMAIKKYKIVKHNSTVNEVMKYYFDIEKCKACPLRDGCYKAGAKSKSYSVSIKSKVHEKQYAFEQTEYFKQVIKQRYKIEAKNSELKFRHGYGVAQSGDIQGMMLQGAMTIFCTNLKRIMKIMKEKNK